MVDLKSLSGTASGKLDFSESVEKVFNLPGARINYPEQGTAYIVAPKNIPVGTELPIIVAVHGSGRGALDYKNEPFYMEQRNIALKNGYMFAAVSNGPDTWGLDDGLYNTLLFIKYLRENFPIRERIVLWATSAGGVITNRIVISHPEIVDFVIGTFPVYDLMEGFALDHCKNAWGTRDIDRFKELIKGKNPAEFPEKLKSHRFFISHGNKDIHVPINAHSEKMRSDVGPNVHLSVIENGVHSTENFSYYDMFNSGGDKK